MESMDRGRPLSFLDAHVKQGNSLIGTTPSLLEAGIPDEAFVALTGDDKLVASSLKRQNKLERQQEEQGKVQLTLSESLLARTAEELAARARDLADLSESSVAAVNQKEDAHAALLSSDAYRSAKLVADAWCAAFFQEKTKHAPVRVTQGLIRRLFEDVNAVPLGDRNAISTLAATNNFFHWYVEFPDVFGPDSRGGFDVVVGNPPWDQIQLDDREFFAITRPDIANAPNMAARKRLIIQLRTEDPNLYNEYLEAIRAMEATQKFIHSPGSFPQTSFGRLNLAPLFAEKMRGIIGPTGRLGVVLPTGIATDSFNQYFFANLIDRRSVVSLFDFENRKKIFQAVDSRVKFCLLTLTGLGRPADEAEFVFFAQAVSDLGDPERRFTLSPEDFALLNPNTKTCPIFRTRRDAEITKAIYRRVPVLVNNSKGDAGNPWGFKGLLMFMMNTDSHRFRVRRELQADGYALQGNLFVKGRERWLPLYEAKMVHHFNHRFGDYALAREGSSDTHLPEVPEPMLNDPDYAPLPRYWVLERDVENRLKGRWDAGWLLGWRDITNATNERTVIASVIPRVGVGNQFALFTSTGPQDRTGLVAQVLTSFPVDYTARQKAGGTHLNFFVFGQLPIVAPDFFDQSTPWSVEQSLAAWITPRVLELTYTSWDLQGFAHDLAYDGRPFRWDAERRFLLRCELDAAFFHLYGISADDTDYILETFPIVRKKDIASFGEYRTKSQILDVYDAMAKAIASGDSYQTILDPPPAHPSAAHLPGEPLLVPAVPRLHLVDSPEEEEMFHSVVPLYDLRVAAGAFSEEQSPQGMGWVEIPNRKVRKGMFVAQVVGHSMEPRISSGSYCLFAHPAGSNQGKIVLAQHREIWDPETGGTFTVKRYRSEKKYSEDGTWEHTEIRLEPLNPAFDPIIIREAEEGELRLIAELVDVYSGSLREP